MNAFLLVEFLVHRYNSHYTELRNKITSLNKPGSSCRNCNPHSSRPVGHSMQRSLKAKLQNAVNQASLADAGTPALFVGGRRRNRKRRKNKNGQSKRKNRKCSEQEFPYVISSVTPDFEYYQDYVAKKPVAPAVGEPVSCLDIEEPVFIYEPVGKTQILITNPDHESVYSSSESLESPTSRRDSGCEEECLDEESDTTTIECFYNEQDQRKTGIPRANSRDSGVFDDEDVSVGDVELDDDISDDDIALTDLSRDDVTSCNLKEELKEAQNDLASATDTTDSQFEEIDLRDNTDVNNSDNSDLTEQVEVKIITDIDHISDPEHFLKLADDDDDIIFDISQLELDTTEDNISNIGKANFQLKIQEGSGFDPTELEEGTPLQKLPMDLLIDDEREEEVLFDAGARRELCITCNPLYEHNLGDNEDKLSVKSYQSGFKTNFDNVNYIRIPGTASTKAQKESSPLLKSQEDDLACCVIL